MTSPSIQTIYVYISLKGVILEGRDLGQEEAYQKAIREANQKLIDLLPRDHSRVKLKSMTKYIEEGNAFQSTVAGWFIHYLLNFIQYN